LNTLYHQFNIKKINIFF